jgi:hydrogenase maturation factor
LDAAARLMDLPGISVVAEAEIARRAGQVTALHDPTEGGLASAVREMAAVSGAGVEIDAEAVPILVETRAVADALGVDPLGMLASGSLLIATRPEGVQRIVHDIEAAGIPVTVVGRLTDDPQEASLISGGTRQSLPEFAVDEVARLLAQEGEERPSYPAPNS